MNAGPKWLPILLTSSLLVGPGCNCGGRHDPGDGLASDDGNGSASNVDFGNVLLNQTSTPHDIIVNNGGSAPLAITSVKVTGPNASDFKITTGLPMNLAAGGQATAVGIFTPSAAGPRAATLEVTTDGLSGVISIQLTGLGIDLEICASPPTLAFGDVQVQGTPVTLNVTLTNCGVTAAAFTLGSVSGVQAGDFSATTNVPSAILPAGDQVVVSVSYAPQALGPSVASLGYQVCDSSNDCAPGSVALTGTGVDGALTFAPNPVSFANVPSGQSTSTTVTATNTGTEAIKLTALATQSGSQTIFAIKGAPHLPASLTPGQSLTFTINYTPSGVAAGDVDQLVGTFTVADSAVAARQALDPLNGNGIPAPCSLKVSPTALNFGNVAPGVATTYSVTLTNLSGSTSCQISNVALSANTDPDYSLPASQPLSFTVAPGGTAKLAVTIEPTNTNAPLLRTGTLTFDSSGTPAMGAIPLTAYVDSACASAASQLIYTVDEDGTFSSFDPTTLKFHVIGVLSCPSDGNPFSMAVDQNAVAWVLYDTGDLFKVNTSNAACSATSFVSDQKGLLNFGMSFMTDPNLGTDTLFVAGGQSLGPTPSELATIAFPTLSLSTVGNVSLGWPELTGTGDGQLWGFVPAAAATGGNTLLAQLDPTTGAELTSYNLSQINSESDGNFALKFYGGDFWLFLGNSVYEVDRATGAFSTPVPNSGHAVVGAGVSTCAPVQ